MRKLVMPLAAAMALAACGSEPAAPPAEEQAAESLKGGQYRLEGEVTALASTDNSKPATPLKVGDKYTVEACVAPDGKPGAELFAEPAKTADKCEVKNDYVHYGRISAQLSCERAGTSGQVMPAMMGSFTADSFEGEITTLTYFVKDGDYRMSRKVSAKRIGECPAGGAAKAG